MVGIYALEVVLTPKYMSQSFTLKASDKIASIKADDGITEMNRDHPKK